MKISLKTKIITTMIALSVITLAIYAKSSMNIYKRDKTALIFDYIANQTQSKALFISHTMESFDILANTILANISEKSNYLPKSTVDYLKKNKKIIAIHFHMNVAKLEELTLIETETKKTINDWPFLRNLATGLSIAPTKDRFFFKKNLKNNLGFIVITFSDSDLASMVESNQDSLNFFVKSNEIIAKNLTYQEDELRKSFFNKINGQNTSFGLFESKILNSNYIISYAKVVNTDIYAVTMKNQSKIFESQDFFVDIAISYLFIIASLALLVGAIASRWLTWNLEKLSLGANQIGNGNFKYKIEINTKDEFQALAKSYNDMGEQIFTLMQELRDHNLHLEKMVEKRTHELKKITDIQNSMLNSLGQAFVMIDKEKNILPIYSKISEDLFEVVPTDSNPIEILAIPDSESQPYNDLLSFAFNKIISISDLTALAPSKRSNSKKQIIHLNYAPIINSENNDIDYIMVIGTDKTKEIESIEKFKIEYNNSQMINKLASNKFTANKLISDSLNMLSLCQAKLKMLTKENLLQIQRKIHTIKGNFSYFNIKQIANLANETENELDKIINNQESTLSVDKLITTLIHEITTFTEKHEGILHFRDSITHKQIEIDNLLSFHQKLPSNRELSVEFQKMFLYTPIKPYLQIYPALVAELAEKSNKEINFITNGTDHRLPDGDWSELFNSFVHFIRNSIDHGIETPEERLSNNKSKAGTIEFSFEIKDELLYMRLSDNGRGIDWKKLSQKDATIRNEDDALKAIIRGGVSEKSEVSELSGRGVGVSAIFEMIKKRNGEYALKNKPGEGFSIESIIPLQTFEKKIRKAA
jgi:two-component system, chemotaxis family, sensor kinase CheA